MRKLLSLLAIGIVAGGISSNTVACRAKKPAINKVDISTKTFTTITYGNNKDIYNGIRQQIGSWADPNVSADAIKNDNYIHITIYESQKSTPTNDDTSTRVMENGVKTVNPPDPDHPDANTFDVQIEVDSSDPYFKEMELTTYDISLSFNKIDVSTITSFADDYANLGSDIYTSVRSSLASMLNITGIDADAIKNDTYITIKITTSNGQDINDDSTAISSDDYNVKISVDPNDKYFTNSTEEPIKNSITTNINLSSFRKFSKKENDKDSTMWELYDVRTQEKVGPKIDENFPNHDAAYLGKYSGSTASMENYIDGFFDIINDNQGIFKSDDKNDHLLIKSVIQDYNFFYLSVEPENSKSETAGHIVLTPITNMKLTPTGYMIITTNDGKNYFVNDKQVSSGGKYQLLLLT